MYQRILVAVDGSPTANAGLREALKLAIDQKARLMIAHVVEEPISMMAPEASTYIGEMIDTMRESGQDVVAKAVALAEKNGVKTETAVMESFSTVAADQILRQARKWKADLIVLGTHGRRGLRRLVLGSDAEQIVRSAEVPVLLVRAKEPVRAKRR